MSFSQLDKDITLLGTAAVVPELAVREVYSLLTTENVPIPSEVQEILDQFPQVFEPPTELPPRHSYDHTITLIPTATPVSMRPYHIAPALKQS